MIKTQDNQDTHTQDTGGRREMQDYRSQSLQPSQLY